MKQISPFSTPLFPSHLNARAFDELRSHLVTAGRIDELCSAFGQTRIAIGQMRAHLRARAQFTKRCAFGQMPRV